MTPHPQICELEQTAFRSALPRLLEIYMRAMRYPAGTVEARLPLWSDHSRRPGFRSVVAVASSAASGDGEIVGLSYGYRGQPGQWWHAEVARGLGPSGRWWLENYFELSELHVDPTRQGHGLGEAMLRRLLGGVDAEHVLLSTPEGENRAWRLYRRTGFRDVLRGFLFTGDSRPFAVLGRTLPLDPAMPQPPGLRSTPPA